MKQNDVSQYYHIILFSQGQFLMVLKKNNLWSVCVSGGYHRGHIFWMTIPVRKLIGNLCIKHKSRVAEMLCLMSTTINNDTPPFKAAVSCTLLSPLMADLPYARVRTWHNLHLINNTCPVRLLRKVHGQVTPIGIDGF